MCQKEKKTKKLLLTFSVAKKKSKPNITLSVVVLFVVCFVLVEDLLYFSRSVWEFSFAG